MNTRKFIFLAIAAAIAVVTAVASSSNQQYTPNAKLRMAEAAIAQLYVDSINEEKLVEDAIRGMLEHLDPHSSYSTPEETKDLNEPLQGSFSGIGITFNMNQDTLYVLQTVSGGPSERVGIMAGDRIVLVNDTAIAGVKMKNSEIMKRLRGPKGTKVNLTVLRREKGRYDTIPFTITRDQIPIYSVDASYMVEPGVGYIRLNKFANETPKEMREAIRALEKKGMKNLILDLTDNGGGYLQAAVDLLGELLPENKLAVYTEGNTSPKYEFKTRPNGFEPWFADGRLVIMANQNSASAAEITAGAVQDWDRGLIVGRRTFGKGLVQRPIPFPDGSMIRLTVSHYYTPSGRNIQKPYVKGNQKEYRDDFKDRMESGELFHADSVKYVDSLRVKTLVRGRDIYGGGGIYPDKFVPLDTTTFTKYYRNVMAKGLFNRYAIKYVEDNRKRIKSLYKNDDRFVSEFEVTPEMLQELFDLATAEGVEFNAEEAEISAPLFRNILKGLIGRDIFENQTYFKVYNEIDPIYQEALRLIKSDEYDTLLSAPPAH